MSTQGHLREIKQRLHTPRADPIQFSSWQWVYESPATRACHGKGTPRFIKEPATGLAIPFLCKL